MVGCGWKSAGLEPMLSGVMRDVVTVVGVTR